MDPLDPADQAVIELLVSVVVAAAVWIVVTFATRRDVVLLRRIQALAPGDVVEPGRGRRHKPGFIERLGARLPGDRSSVAKGLETASLSRFNPDQVIGLRLVLAAVAVLAGIRFGRFGLVIAPFLGFLAYRVPDTVLGALVKARREEINGQLPDAVDLLAVCTRAGLNLALSLKRVADEAQGVLGREFQLMVKQIELGIPRREAMAKLAARVELEDLDALVATVANADRFGTQVAGSLETLSSEIRMKRRRAAEEQARRAPVKILFPLVFLILPAFILLTVVPLLLGTFRSLGL